MKTKRERKQIEDLCMLFNAVAHAANNELTLEYDDEDEMIYGVFNTVSVKINVHMDSVSAVYRDVIRGLAACMQ